MQVLLALERLNANLERYLDVTIPAVVAIAEQEDAGIEARVAAIHWIARTCRRLNVLEFASRIVHPLARLLDTDNPPLHGPAILALCCLMQALLSLSLSLSLFLSLSVSVCVCLSVCVSLLRRSAA